MDQLAAGFAIDPATVCNEVHEAQKCNGDDKGEKSGDEGVHGSHPIDVGYGAAGLRFGCPRALIDQARTSKIKQGMRRR